MFEFSSQRFDSRSALQLGLVGPNFHASKLIVGKRM